MIIRVGGVMLEAQFPILAAVSGVMKDFFDRSYYGALDRINGRAFALLVCAGSDGAGAACAEAA